MKLITKYNRVNIVATVLVLFLSSICYYYIVRYILIDQLDNTLKVEEAEILDYVKHNDRLPEATNYKDQHISFTATDLPATRKFRNIKRAGESDKEYNPYRQLSFPLTVNGKYYNASVTKSEVEVEYIVGLIVLTTGAVIFLLLLILFISNRLLLRKLWKPFYNTLDSIGKFNLSGKKYISNQNTDVDEFRDLDKAVHMMTSTIIKDYETIKNFADNASHEMQTPLAIMNAKLDLLIQEPDLAKNQLQQLQGIYDAVSRLTRLNQSLLLLTKIENKQFTGAELLRLDKLIVEKLSQLEDFSSAKHLQVNCDLKEVTINMDNALADILLNNLLGNAIRHNQDNGIVNISLNPAKLQISNTGSAFTFDSVHVFDRFRKGDRSEGIGLGLAMAKQICDNYQFQISYSFINHFHSFTLSFES